MDGSTGVRAIIAALALILVVSQPVQAQVSVISTAAPWSARITDLAAAAQRWEPERRVWTPVAAQQGVQSGDRLRVDAGSHLGIDFGGAWLIVAGGSEVELPTVLPQQVQLRLVRGSMALRLSAVATPLAFDLMSDEVRVQALGAGVLRLDRVIQRDPATRVTALLGPARILHPEPQMDVLPGQRVEVSWSAGRPEARSLPVEVDRFHQLLAAGPAAGATAGLGEMPPGLAELDGHGQWDRHPEYGAVWWPSNAARDWEPYRDGRWIWVQPGQWVWWEDSGWGMTPFHTGRWIQWRERWVWAPRLAPPRAPPAPGHAHRPMPRPVTPHPLQPAPHPITSAPEERSPHDERRFRIPRYERPDLQRDTPPASPTALPAPPAVPRGFGAVSPNPGQAGGGPSLAPPRDAPREGPREGPREPKKDGGRDRRDRDRERER